jgi:peroxiredoxin Q/BCP
VKVAFIGLFNKGQSMDEMPKVGDLAPDFTLPDQDGNLHRLSDYRGKNVVLYFFPIADTPG